MRHVLSALATLLVIALVQATAFAGLTVVVDKTNSIADNGTDNAWVAGQITFDSSYATGGEALTAAAVETAIQTAGYVNGQCNGLERVILATGEVSDVPYLVGWDDENGKAQAFQRATVTTEDTAGVANTPTAITVIAAESCVISGTTCTLAQTPISILAGGLVGGTSDGLAADFMVGTPNAAREVGVSGTTLTINTGDATSIDVTYAYVSTAGVASTPHTHTAGAAAAEVTAATDLSGLEVEFFAICSL